MPKFKAKKAELGTVALTVTSGKESEASPTEQQTELPLFEGFFSSEKNESRTFEIFDALPKYVYAKVRQAKDLTPITKTITLRRKTEAGINEELQVEVTLTAAVVKGANGLGQAIYPGAREELVSAPSASWRCNRSSTPACTPFHSPGCGSSG